MYSSSIVCYIYSIFISDIFIKPPSRPESHESGQLRPQSVPAEEILNNGSLDDQIPRVGASPSPGLVVTSVAGPLKLFKCELCPFVCLSEAKWSTHVEKHTTSKFNRRKFYCGGCENIFYEQQSMKLHLIEDHLMGELEAIELTEFTFKANPFVPSKKFRKRGISIKNVQTLKKPDLIESTELIEQRRPLRDGQKIFVKSVEVLKRPDLPSPSPSPSPNPPTTSPNIYMTQPYNYTTVNNTPPHVCRGPITFPSSSFTVKTSNSPMLASPLPTASYFEASMDVDSEPERSQSTENKKIFIPNVLPRTNQPDPLMPMTTIHLKSIDEVNMLSFNEIQAPPLLNIDASFNFDSVFGDDLTLNPILNDTDTILDHISELIDQNLDHNFASLLEESASSLLSDVGEKKVEVKLQPQPSNERNPSPVTRTLVSEPDEASNPTVTNEPTETKNEQPSTSASSDIADKPRGRIYVASNLMDPKIVTKPPESNHEQVDQTDTPSDPEKPRGRIYIASNLVDPKHSVPASEKPRPRIYVASNLLEKGINSNSLSASLVNQPGPKAATVGLSTICQDHFYAAPSSTETNKEMLKGGNQSKPLFTEEDVVVPLPSDVDDENDDDDCDSSDERQVIEETVIEEIIVEEVLEPLDLVKDPSEKKDTESNDMTRKIFVARNLSHFSSPITEPVASSSNVQAVDTNLITRRSERLRKSGKCNDDLLFCNVSTCSSSFKDQNVLEYHQRCHSIDLKCFKCPECTETFRDAVLLHTHLWRFHRIDLELYSCDKCEYKTPLLSRLQTEHFQIHCGEKLVECEECGKHFKTPKHCRDHKKLHSIMRGEQFPIERIQKCNECNLVFSNRSSLRTHKLTLHATAPAEFACDKCPRSFNTHPALKTHYKKHAEEKYYKCPDCDYESNDHNSFRRHKMKHSNTGMYACPYCTYTSIQSTTYRRHLETKHTELASDLLYKCQLCKFVSISQQKYDVHMTKHRLDSAKKDLLLQRAQPANSPELIYLNPNVPVNVRPALATTKQPFTLGHPLMKLKTPGEIVNAVMVPQQIQKIPTPPLVHHLIPTSTQFTGVIPKTQP